MNSHIPHWLKAIPALLLFLSFLPGAEAAQARPAKLSVEYVYAPDGTLAGRTVNGQVQRFEYDKRGQLLAVKDSQDNDLERYVYDPAGNILSKTVHGKTTRFTYDAANQITSRTNPDGSVVQYRYDAAGRLVQEGTRSYVYGYQDKVEAIRENGKTVARFAYGLDGQLESVTRADGSVEHFYWDGLALIGRGKSTFLNEPYMTGGNPIVSDGKAMLNDMLGSTVGIRDGEKVTPVAMTAFGESSDPEAMYTGKPHVDGLGYAFLFRNYRAEFGKWQTADPLGYPDGWNPLAYCNNDTVMSIDWLGGVILVVYRDGKDSLYGHRWVEIHNEGHMDIAVGFWPSDAGWGKPGIVLVGEAEPYSKKTEAKKVIAVYDVSEADATYILQSAYNSYNNKVIYNPLIGGDVCWNFTDLIKDKANDLGYKDISDRYLPADLMPDKKTYGNIEKYANRFSE